MTGNNTAPSGGPRNLPRSTAPTAPATANASPPNAPDAAIAPDPEQAAAIAALAAQLHGGPPPAPAPLPDLGPLPPPSDMVCDLCGVRGSGVYVRDPLTGRISHRDGCTDGGWVPAGVPIQATSRYFPLTAGTPAGGNTLIGDRIGPVPDGPAAPER